jgi:hypothetical protein
MVLYRRAVSAVLVHFDSEVGGLTMLGDIAVQLLKLMGHSGTVPSAILAADIPAALARLEQALAQSPTPAAAGDGGDEARDGEPRVSLQQRAYPLVQLLKAAAKRECDLMWDRR